MILGALAATLLTAAIGFLGQELGRAGSPPPLPSGIHGVSQDAALEIARSHVAPDATFRSASAGRFADVYPGQRLGPRTQEEADRLVWAVEFASVFVICPPDGGPCRSPRPGSSTAIIDFRTGEWITTLSFSPGGQ